MSTLAPVLLATSADLPDGEEWTGTTHLLDAFAARGIDARWVIWDDPAVDWSEGLVAVRATWDYDGRRDEFLAWARSLPWMLNSAEVFAWNSDKAYLIELAAAGVSVVPTISVDFGPLVLKPRVGAGGRGVLVSEGAGPWVVQPLVESVRTEGETSVFVLDGRVVSQVRKLPAAGEIRVHEQYGGHSIAVPVTDEAATVARAAVAAAEKILGTRLDYARVDQMRLVDGRLAVSELEAIEPGLYLDVIAANAGVFADLVAARLADR